MKIKGELTDIKKEKTIQKALQNFMKLRGFEKVKANIEGFEAPARLTNRTEDISYVPDITAVKQGSKSYFEVAVKSGRIQKTLSKWRLLSELAKLRHGKFYLLVPKGNFAFVQRTLADYPIDAEVVKI
jgi:hypothetical protein